MLVDPSMDELPLVELQHLERPTSACQAAAGPESRHDDKEDLLMYSSKLVRPLGRKGTSLWVPEKLEDRKIGRWENILARNFP